MPNPRTWTLAELDTIRAMRADHASWDAVGLALGCARWTVIQLAKRAGIVDDVAPDPEPEQRPEPSREPLPAGHPISWGAICVGTCLEGQEFWV